MIVLCDGSIIFDGRPSEMSDRIESIGYKIPKFTTPTDYFMKFIDRDEIRIQYENQYGQIPASDPHVVEKLYRDRLNSLMNFENKSNFLQKKSIVSVQKSQFRMSQLDVSGEIDGGGKNKMKKKVESNVSLEKSSFIIIYIFKMGFSV